MSSTFQYDQKSKFNIELYKLKCEVQARSYCASASGALKMAAENWLNPQANNEPKCFLLIYSHINKTMHSTGGSVLIRIKFLMMGGLIGHHQQTSFQGVQSVFRADMKYSPFFQYANYHDTHTITTNILLVFSRQHHCLISVDYSFFPQYTISQGERESLSNCSLEFHFRISRTDKHK